SGRLPGDSCPSRAEERFPVTLHPIEAGNRPGPGRQPEGRQDRLAGPTASAAQESRNSIQTKLFVGNLDYGTTPDELQALFAESGEVLNVTLPTDRESGRPRGFAFVEMSTAEQAAAAREKLNGFALHGRPLRVDAATEKAAPAFGSRGGFDRGPRNAFAPAPRHRPKGSRRNLRARKRSL